MSDILWKKERTAQACALSESTIDTLERQGKFPRRRQISSGGIGYLVEEVQEWARLLPVSEILPPKNCGYGRAGKPTPETPAGH